MISLTLLPSQSQAKLGPLNMIAGEPNFASTELPNQKPAGGSLSFASRKVIPSLEEKTSAQARVKVRLAEDEVLLPFYNRPVEVKDLLSNTNSKTKQLFQSMEKLFFNSPQDWQALQTLFFEVDREELGDREWLARIYCLLFVRSPSIWCRLADCLGAHALDWSAFSQDFKDEDDDMDSIKYDDDVFTDSGSSFMTERTHARSSSGPANAGFELEALHEVPQSFRVPPIRARRPSSYLQDDDDTEMHQQARQHRSLRHRRGSSLISTGEDDDVHDFLASKADGFAGIRLSWSGQDRRSWSPHQSQPQPQSQLHNRTINAPSYLNGGGSSTTQVRQRGATVSGPQHHQQQHKYTHHRRLSSLFTTPISEQTPPSKQDTSTRGSGKTTSPRSPSAGSEKRVSPASAFARSYSAPRVKSSVASPKEEVSSRLGLLPDGRTRHPSAGDGEGPASKEAAALLAFKRELQLSGYGKSIARESTQSTSSLSSILSPTLSEDSFATTISTSASPETSKRSPEIQAIRLSKQPSTTHSTALIFPISSSLGRPRSKHLLDQLNRAESHHDLMIVKKALGADSYKRLCQLIMEKERSECSDQLLLEIIAKDCFDLIDQEKDSRDVIEAHLIDEGYDKRWDAFVKLCHAWDVDSAVIREAKRRGGPAVRLF